MNNINIRSQDDSSFAIMDGGTSIIINADKSIHITGNISDAALLLINLSRYYIKSNTDDCLIIHSTLIIKHNPLSIKYIADNENQCSKDLINQFERIVNMKAFL